VEIEVELLSLDKLDFFSLSSDVDSFFFLLVVFFSGTGSSSASRSLSREGSLGRAASFLSPNLRRRSESTKIKREKKKRKKEKKRC